MHKITAKWSVLIAVLALILGGMQTVVAADKPFAKKKIVLQITDGDPKKQTLILNVANNLLKEYGTDEVQLEIVAFGPGLGLLLDKNKNKGRVQGLAENGVDFLACSNTVKKVTKKNGGKAPKLHLAARSDSPGVVRIVKLVTEEGWTLIRP